MTIAAGALMAFASCNSFTDYTPKDATPEDIAFGDSLSESFGEVFGQDINNWYHQLDSLFRSKIDKKKVLEGIKYALQNTGDTADYSIMNGVQMGLQISQQLMEWENGGVPVNRTKLYNALEKAYMGDTIPADKVAEIQGNFRMFSGKAGEKMQEIHKAKLENDPKAIENKKASEAFIAKKKQENPNAQVTQNGTVVVVKQEGTGEPIKAGETAKLIYKGMLIDGTSFDDSQGEAREFSPASVVPGFGEAMQLMKKGGKYTIYIPCEQGYGVEGIPQAGIGPNSALVFDIEVVSINK